MLAVGGLDCWVQVGVPGRGQARGSCWILRLPPCSLAALSDSAVGLCPSHARVLDGNLPGEDPPCPAIKFYHEGMRHVQLITFSRLE